MGIVVFMLLLTVDPIPSSLLSKVVVLASWVTIVMFVVGLSVLASFSVVVSGIVILNCDTPVVCDLFDCSVDSLPSAVVVAV